MKKLIGIFFLGYVISNSALADSNSHCGDFHIQISNLTNTACILTSQKVMHGNLITPPPMAILPNDSKRFDMSQTLAYGPEIMLSFQCGEENISFVSQQNLCVLEAGNITGTILPPSPVNINTDYMALLGSYWWEKSGSISWKLLKFG